MYVLVKDLVSAMKIVTTMKTLRVYSVYTVRSLGQNRWLCLTLSPSAKGEIEWVATITQLAESHTSSQV